MSCCPPSITPDFADGGGGGGGGGGVTSVLAGTNVTITGTSTSPIVNAFSAVNNVSSVQGLSGAITLSGNNCSITTNANDINFTVPIQGIQSLGVTGNGISKTGTSTDPILENTGVTSLREMIGDISLNAGTNITITDDFANKTITINATGGGGGGSVNSVSVTGGGLALTGTPTDPILQNTGVLSITTPFDNGSGLAITNGGVGNTQMHVLLESGNGCVVRPSTTSALLYVDNGGILDINGKKGSLTLTAGTNITLTSVGNGYTIANPVYQATYYKSTAQTLTNGNTDLTFDLTAPWNNVNGLITHTNGTTDFTVVTTGLYQLEFNAVILANGAVYSTSTIGKSVAIDVTRTGIAEQAIISNTAFQTSLQNYTMSITGTFYLIAGDVLNLRVGNQFTAGPPTAQQGLNTFDLNTYFSWRFISP